MAITCNDLYTSIVDYRKWEWNKIARKIYGVLKAAGGRCIIYSYASQE